MKSNPWTKKNPFMSMWLSGANSVAGAARAQATAAVKREVTKATKSAASQASAPFADFWSAALGVPATTPKKRKRRAG